MEKYDLSVFIGRFQPFHLGHQETVRHALSISERVLILVGSSGAATSSKNPFSYQERSAMIRASLSTDENYKVDLEPLQDHFYSDDVWIAEVQEKVSRYSDVNSSIALVGRYKDRSTYYLSSFPQWEFSDSRSTQAFSATDIREAMFMWDDAYSKPSFDTSLYNAYQPDYLITKIHPDKWVRMVPEGVTNWLMENYLRKAKYADNVSEYNKLRLYKEAWKSAPFPVTYVTVDSVVMCLGHVLLVKRKFNPGLGLLALPGGFLKQEETLLDAAVRELREESGIRINTSELKRTVDGSKVFDYPGRSLRGRTITHAFCIRLPGTDGLPQIRAGSDAEQVRWVPVAEALASSEKFFEDHYSILNSFLVR